MIIVDMVMPSMTGKELFLKLREIKPHLKLVISSGYQMNENNAELLQMGIKGFINKPFSMDILATKLHEFVDS